MYLTSELAREQQNSMLASATEMRQGLRIRALARARRRATRAARDLAIARSETDRLLGELAAEQES
jgi:hypothetical protein